MTTDDRRAVPADDRVGTRRYAFGDAEEATQRLQLLDRVFAQPSRTLVDTVGRRPVGLAVDLGCGPGLTTRLLAEGLRPDRLAGLDASRAFLTQAATAVPSAEWFLHDVTKVPFPTGPADVLHARFVLAHLAGPESLLAKWLEQLTPGGTLLVLEDEEIVADHPVLIAYEEMARSLVARRGGDLWVGARLARLEPPQGYETVENRVQSHRVPAALAARMFSMNFAVWRRDPFIIAEYPASLLEEMGTGLARAARADGGGDVDFRLRQLAIRRGDGSRPLGPQ
jgi:trans-aconitate 2-methyltransferase